MHRVLSRRRSEKEKKGLGRQNEGEIIEVESRKGGKKKTKKGENQNCVCNYWVKKKGGKLNQFGKGLVEVQAGTDYWGGKKKEGKQE